MNLEGREPISLEIVGNAVIPKLQLLDMEFQKSMDCIRFGILIHFGYN